MKKHSFIIDVSFFTIWNDALQSSKTYNELLQNIELANEKIPLPKQTLLYTFKNRGISIEVPMNFYFKLCYFLGKETQDEKEKIYYFSKAVSLFEKNIFKYFREYYLDEYNEMKPFYIKGCKPSYEVLYGDDTAKQMKENLKQKMSSLDDTIIKNRNKKISQGMLNYFHHHSSN